MEAITAWGDGVDWWWGTAGCLRLCDPWRSAAAAAAAELLQSCPTLCDPIDGSPPGSPVPGILQAGTLEWVAISFSNAWKWKVKVKSLSRVQLLATPWTAAYQAPPSMGFSRLEYSILKYKYISQDSLLTSCLIRSFLSLNSLLFFILYLIRNFFQIFFSNF